MRRALFLLIAIALCAGQAASSRAAEPAADAAGLEFYESKIRPLLAEKCYACHGEAKQRSMLRLDRTAAMRAGGESGPAVVPGDIEGSLLIQAVRYGADFYQMPPSGKLRDDEIELLTEWVRRGAPAPDDAVPLAAAGEFNLAERRKHWSFQPIAAVAPPVVQDDAWPLTDADRFLLARLEEAGLTPAPQADKRTLIRRATYDLIGLPPTPEDVEAFLADDSPEAFARVVDRLLASPHFGERWARHWLDLVRFGETKGHEFDPIIPNAYQYRDYVIRAFNADVPYDQFVTEHVAGDLVQPPRLHPDLGWNESILGTGFWFLGEEVHSPVDIRLDVCERNDNKIDVLTKTFLGLTVACARCHDHKFDAISAKDYYALGGFLLSSSYRQVPFATLEQNRRVAAELAEVRDRSRANVQAAIVAAERPTLERLAEYLLAARDVMLGRAGVDPLTEAEVAAAQGDILFEDFERDDYGGWTTTGTAFGAGPVVAAEMPDYQGDVGARGRRLVNSHFTRGGDANGDAHVGTLTSPPFTVDRDYIHLLIDGGAHAGRTCINVVVEGQAVLSATGRESNQLAPHTFDVRAWRGQTVRLEVVDQELGGWGNIGCDHIVFSDSPNADVLNETHSATDAVLLRARAERAAAERGLRPGVLVELVAQLQVAANQPAHPLHAWALVAADERADDPARCAEIVGAIAARRQNEQAAVTAALSSATVLVDYAHLPEGDWLQDGYSFGPRPLAVGDVRWGSDPARPIVEVVARAAATFDTAWNVQTLAPATEREIGRINWVQSGRTLRTPTLTLGRGKLYYLVRGSGHVYAGVDQHRLVEGPLHSALVKSFNTGEEYGWVEHDLTPYAGHRVHLEFSPREPGAVAEGESAELAVAMVVEADAQPPLPPATGALTEPRALASGESASVESLANAIQNALLSAADRLAADSIRGAADAVDVAPVANWLVASHAWLGESPADASDPLAEFSAARSQLLSQIARESPTAPALLDGSGVDEFLLVRGSPKSPGDVVPRRFLEAIAGEQPPIPRGSGRLELARRMTDPTNPFLARVAVNRVWHHLFGRGIVASVDNFGLLGERPTHPELLDHLAAGFVADGWSVKRLIRRVMLGRAYRMSSTADLSADERDPDNRLLHRANLRRLEGEAIRDSLLAVSGRLDPRLFGPSVEVYLSDFMEGRGRPAASGPLDGDGRRSVYLRVRRNFLSPMFLSFDFPIPFNTIGRRTVSNVPAQALTLMNDPFVVEQARLWSQRILARAGLSPAQRVERMYLELYSRPPDADESAAALAFLADQAARYGAAADDPRAWADLAHVLVNVKEFIFVR